ncbi:long-chain fatty acid--CoA ligase [Candidatus Parcubacteria bacterium]|nr:MAG: long-chain fatty acid--CoA ligase [Candidatus Parcubacteria bacterium]
MSGSVTNFYEHAKSFARSAPERPALVACDDLGKTLFEISYGELPGRLEAAAKYLHSLGIQKGDRVAVAFRNSVDLLILNWAAWGSGIVTVPLDVKRDTEEQCTYKIELNNAKALIVQKGAFGNVPALKVPIVEYTSLPADIGGAVEWENDPSHLALILFTSGTTAHPKGAKLTLHNLLVNADSIGEWLHITERDRFLVQLPLHHINSTTFTLATLLRGGTIVVPPMYSNSRFWAQVAETHATITSIVQSILADQLDRTDAFEKVKNTIMLNRIQIGSAPVVAHTVQEFIREFGINVYQGYGQTETALRVTGVPMGLPDELYRELIKDNSIGAPMKWADLHIADKDGNILGEGEEGELIVKGAAIMEGYVAGEEAFRDGYFLTGDIGLYKTINGTRFFYLKGRSREIIIKGGINISPVAVENGLKKLSPDISQVYCIGREDDRYGEEVAVAVCWREGVDQESALRRLKFMLLSGTDALSAYETPKFFASIGAHELPLTSTGKVQRTVLRKNLSPEQFSSIYDILKTQKYQLSVLPPHSPLIKTSHALYEKCWDPIKTDFKQYEKDVSKHLILMALDSEGKIAGQIAFVRTGLSAEELLQTTYADLLTPKVLNQKGDSIICISICSAEYKAKPIPEVKNIPEPKDVQTYLDEGKDAVMRFHQKPKGGLPAGASLVGLIPNGRPEDMSACGYNMLLAYPSPTSGVRITDDAPVSNQLIEAALLVAHEAGLSHVYAYSRPGGLAAYWAER